MSLGKRLKAARVAKGYGLRRAQMLSGVSFSTISKAERDVGEIGSQTLEKLARCYGVTIDGLMLDNAPSLRADPATVRRAVLMADLKAVCSQLENGTEEEQQTSDVLNSLIAALVEGKTKELAHYCVELSVIWLAQSYHKHLRATAPDYADARDMGGAE